MNKQAEIEGRAATKAYRFVIAGFSSSDEARDAVLSLRRAGIAERKLCLIERHPSDETPKRVGADRQTSLRTIDGMALRVSSAKFFDDTGIADYHPNRHGPSWMTEAQAKTFWDNVARGASVVIANGATHDQQATCSRVMLDHGPRFLHTFTFSR